MVPVEHWIQMGIPKKMYYNYKNYRQTMSQNLKGIFNLFKKFGV